MQQRDASKHAKRTESRTSSGWLKLIPHSILTSNTWSTTKWWTTVNKMFCHFSRRATSSSRQRWQRMQLIAFWSIVRGAFHAVRASPVPTRLLKADWAWWKQLQLASSTRRSSSQTRTLWDNLEHSSKCSGNQTKSQMNRKRLSRKLVLDTWQNLCVNWRTQGRRILRLPKKKRNRHD